jgi:hypothetical protein
LEARKEEGFFIWEMNLEEDPELLLAFDLADAVASTILPVPGTGPKTPVSAATAQSCDIAVEPRSKLRMSHWEYPPDELAVLLAGRTVHSIKKLAGAPPDVKSQADWSTIGVLCKKHDVKASSSDNKRVNWVITDFNYTLSVMLFGEAYEEHKFAVGRGSRVNSAILTHSLFCVSCYCSPWVQFSY